MKKTFTSRLTLIASIAVMASFPGCNRPDKPAAEDGHGHAGHNQAKAEAASPSVTGAFAQVALSGAKCAAHDAARELCFICDASLREKGRLWCEEHKRYEDRCWLCHPEFQDKNRLWCKEHSLYEDECFLCHPELRGKVKTAGSAGAALMCNEHGVLEAECAVCKPELAARLAPGESMKVRLPSPNSAAIAGIQTSLPETGAIADSVECVAELSFNQNKLAQIAAPVTGIIQTVDVDLGTLVEENQTVARIWSAAIAEAVAKSVLTHQTLERERKLHASRVTSEQALQAAEAAHRAACQQARTFGFSEEQIDALGQRPNDPVYLEVRAPFGGEIVERTAVRGALAEAGKALFIVTDRSTMWAMLHVPEAALARLKTGQPVELRTDSLPGKIFTGQLTWIGPAVDERTRMARARAEFANPDGLLKDKMFTAARILTRQEKRAMLVPASAIQRIEGRPYVFVKMAADLFDARAVRLGATFNGRRELLQGVTPQDQIAVSHAFAIKSAMLMSRLGAGCADD
ncbi:MAG: efflux RND transporter periplasmic adaptor subunit [Opitutaceae bacterium]|nr:efflux RND transporter periplasmic adaptor subunit [Opitutaceae bacterium]